MQNEKFQEAQIKVRGLYKQMQSCKTQIFKRDREARADELVLKQLEEMQRDTAQQEPLVAYKSVGKAFFRQPIDDIQTDLQNAVEKNKREANVLERTLQYLESDIRDQESILQEMLTAK
ncbi:hypothetical protein MP228_001772 [Amoeboaphelidium protococcarum]|nr:hypothetical protein MP228_001772 [Amoeboaphelidium protococcarum]